MGVVGPAGEVNAHGIGERSAAGCERGAHGAARPLDQLRRPGEADAPHLALRHAPLHQTLEIFGTVRPQQLGPRGRASRENLGRLEDAGLKDAFSQQAVLLRREAMAGWKGEPHMIGVEGLHRSARCLTSAAVRGPPSFESSTSE